MKVIAVFALIVLVYFNRNEYQPITNAKSEFIEVEIKGLVKNPGTYKLKYLSKIEDLIQKSGGILDEADDSLINYTKKLKNHDVIVVSQKQEKKLISLNASTQEELVTIPGVGPAIAQKIIGYRSEIGSFQAIEDVMLVKGIKQKLFDKMKDFITL